jgi:hypothetical protein
MGKHRSRPSAIAEENALNAIPPLRKTRQSTGAVYARFPDVEEVLLGLYALSDTEVVQRCAIPYGSSGYVPTECVIHFLRHRLYTPKAFEPLFRILQRRVRKLRLGKIDPDYNEQVREGAFGRFHMLIAKETQGYEKRLDIFEVNFRTAFSMLMIDELREHAAHAAHEIDLSPSDEDDDGNGDFEDGTDSETMIRRIDAEQRVKVLRDCATLRQRNIVKLIWWGTPIETSIPGKHSISSLLGVDPKTVRSDLMKVRTFLKSLK